MKFEDDYYGEKIEDFSDYRKWLRKMHHKKREIEKLDAAIAAGEEPPRD